MTRKKRRKGRRLDDAVVIELPFKKKQYSIWDIAVEGCGVRISSSAKSCVISVRVGTKKKFETLGPITEENPYSKWVAVAMERIATLKGGRLPKMPVADGDTLRKAMEDYLTEHPKLGERSKHDYPDRIGRYFGLQLDQGFERITREEILRLNRVHLAELTKLDPTHQPPNGFYSWQSTLRCLRAVVCWRAAQKGTTSPWPDRRALPLLKPPARKLPLELQTATGRRKLMDGLRAMNTKSARGCLFLAYTGFRRREGMRCTVANLVGARVLEFKSKTRELRVPLSLQATALIDKKSETTLLRVREYQLRKPLIRIFGERMTSRGKKKSCVTPHDLRRLFKSVGTELGIDPTIVNILVGHALTGVDKSYIESLRIGILGEAVQKIAAELDNPREVAGEDDLLYYVDESSKPAANDAGAKVAAADNVDSEPSVRTAADFLLSDADEVIYPKDKPAKLYHYLKREELYKLVWTAPIAELAPRFGLSGVGLAKTCKRARIPVPGRGYWAKVESGLDVEWAPLPKAPASLDIIRVRDKIAQPQLQPEPQPQESLPLAA